MSEYPHKDAAASGVENRRLLICQTRVLVDKFRKGSLILELFKLLEHSVCVYALCVCVCTYVISYLKVHCSQIEVLSFEPGITKGRILWS